METSKEVLSFLEDVSFPIESNCFIVPCLFVKFYLENFVMRSLKFFIIMENAVHHHLVIKFAYLSVNQITQ